MIFLSYERGRVNMFAQFPQPILTFPRFHGDKGTATNCSLFGDIVQRLFGGKVNSSVQRLISETGAVLDATNGIGQVWEVANDDSKETLETENVKTYYFPVNEYEEWMKTLEKMGLSYYRHDHQTKYNWIEKMTSAYLDNNEICSLEKWQDKLINKDGHRRRFTRNCLGRPLETTEDEHLSEATNKWKEMGVEKINKFAGYFDRWWKLKYEMWMIYTRGISRDTMDTNNLNELFHRKLKCTYMRG
ncbi:hypothetical protein C2G38_2146450 [Gigaspora rosea]|uniref:Uncharacterized protein n=1 Tax=Gigaspora rosea TaxID=44941 RepID=A0A397UH77_9GLOM|nr:hypothetical protein C2G38_2146450 [Gigaspora rosea]